MNKKGWIAVVEAVIAIVILFTFLFLALEQRTKQESKVDFFSLSEIIIGQVKENETLRNYILREDNVSVKNNFLSKLGKLNMNIDLATCISKPSESCLIDLPAKDVFALDFFIASNQTNYEQKKLKVFIWEK